MTLVMSNNAQRRRTTRPKPSAPQQAAEAAPGLGVPGREPGRIGDILRRVRESRGESLDAVSAYVKIRRHYLDALEASQYQALPADTYAIGFLKTYADYLGLDGKAAVTQFRREVSGRSRQPELYMPQPEPEGRAPTAAIIIGGLFLALVVYALWYSLSSTDRASVTPPEVPVTTATADPLPAVTAAVPQTAPIQAALPAAVPAITQPVPMAQPVAPTIAATTQPAAAVPGAATLVPPMPKGQVYGETRAPARVQIKVLEESWILVTDSSGNNVFDKILRPGDVYNVPNIKGLNLTTGNGAGIVVSRDGQPLPRLGDKGRVVRNVSLDPEGVSSDGIKLSP